MSLRIAAIELDDRFSHYVDASEKALARLDGLSRVNILVGANNSGKSRFLRLLSSSDKPPRVQYAGTGLSAAANRLSELKSELRDILSNSGLVAAGHATEPFLNPSDLTIGELGANPLAADQTTWKAIAATTTISSTTSRSQHTRPPDSLVGDFQRLGQAASAVIDTVKVSAIPKYERVYIPVLRGLRRLTTGHNEEGDPYALRTYADYFGGDASLGTTPKTAPKAFTGLRMYSEVQRMLLGTLEERERIAEYQRFLAKTFFEGEEVTLIPRLEDDRILYLKIGRERERPAYQFGDGLQACLILTFPYFMGDSGILLIEEPELFLHPGLQRKVLDLFQSDRRSHLVFFTTHSNHLLDMTMDYRETTVISFRKVMRGDGRELDGKFIVETCQPSEPRILAELGVRNSSVFLVNATIWVEGITDRLYLRRLLALFQERMRNTGARVFSEDVHFAFVEYGGSNVTHWSFDDSEPNPGPMRVDRVCSRAFLVADRDDEARKVKRRERLKAELAERFLVLPCREIENLLPPRVLQAVIQRYENAPSTVKASVLSRDQYRDQPLGRFIEQTLLGGKKRRKGAYAEDSGTLSGKLDFADKALQELGPNDWDDEMEKVARPIYEFITTQNS